MNAISIPSGDHAGWWSFSAVDVTDVGRLPGRAASTFARSHPVGEPGHSCSNTISVDPRAGDQDGLATKHVPNVIWTGPPPAGSIVQICGKPVRLLTNAIRDPSDDHAGLASYDPAGLKVSWARPVPSALTA